MLRLALALCLVGAAALSAPARYPAPADAVVAFRAALEADDRAALLGIFGQESEDLLFTGDAGRDADNRAALLEAWSALSRVGPTEDGAGRILYLGRGLWPFPFPIVAVGDGAWAFDAEAGRETVTLRRIGRNELDVIALLRAYVDVQAEYRRTDWDGDGVMAFAAHVISSEGARDGLYWPDAAGAPSSPVGDLVARAAAEGFSFGEEVSPPEAYLGYVYHVLRGQGPSAPGGAMAYEINGRMLAGHALIAYPAAYGETGVMTFIVGENGVIHERDLGEDTLAVAGALELFDPGPGWTPLD
ncbi:DUF2950 family protein [Rubrimonas cliftonensis]|uniref:DUF2950 domain-containing protein n=1 Tax=Rubrimonas cliftonensis TaxID=89524 RepID=A0A1H3YHC8_9RHOB|nr:DUF2950 family protein [Rubrimonas cliftonensis]SEA10965.1 Protein of unknown function [Rubrimonas cliftonensis]